MGARSDVLHNRIVLSCDPEEKKDEGKEDLESAEVVDVLLLEGVSEREKEGA